MMLRTSTAASGEQRRWRPRPATRGDYSAFSTDIWRTPSSVLQRCCVRFEAAVAAGGETTRSPRGRSCGWGRDDLLPGYLLVIAAPRITVNDRGGQPGTSPTIPYFVCYDSLFSCCVSTSGTRSEEGVAGPGGGNRPEPGGHGEGVVAAAGTRSSSLGLR